MKKAIILFLFLLVFTVSRTFAQSGDLEVVSVDPETVTVPVGTTFDLLVVVNQNGPDDLPIGSARVSVSINTAFINWVIPVVLTDDCGNVWTVQTANPTPTTSQIQLRNNNSALVYNAGCIIHIPVKAVAAGSAGINVTSTVFGPGVSDPNGVNQSANSIMVITPVLPVTLVSFTAAKENGAANLNWATTAETNSDRFEIEHSVTGKDWNKIGTVLSNGESTVKRNYAFTDKNVVNGENLYRLKMIDKDATFAYSRIQSVKFDGLNNTVASIFPNPSSDKIFLQDTDLSLVKQVSILDMNGRAVFSSNKVSADGINVSKFISGTYILHVANVNGSVSNHKIVIAK